jgi:hypothetical protein
MFIFMLILAFSFKEENGIPTARVSLVAVFGLLFIIVYSPTAGTSPFAISAEVFPLVVREVGHSLAVAVNFIGLGIVLLVFPSLSDAMGGYRGSLSLFVSFTCLLTFIFFCDLEEKYGNDDSFADTNLGCHITGRSQSRSSGPLLLIRTGDKRKVL